MTRRERGFSSDLRIVVAPGGRKFVLQAEPIGVPPWMGGAAFFMRPLGWLLHFLLGRGWRVIVSEPGAVGHWSPPPTREAGKFQDESAALEELNRLAELIEAGTWPPPT
jgi:hypothetical protein